MVLAAVNGDLSKRANVEKINFEFREIPEGMNKTLDAVIIPLYKAANYVDKISKGIIPPLITENYNGDFNTLKNNINQCINSLNGVIEEMHQMSKNHELGDIDAQIQSSNFKGAYASMAIGVNQMVKAHIEVKKKAMAVFMEFGNGNFEASMEMLPGKKRFINDAIEQVRENLKALVDDAQYLSQAAVAGNLSRRANASKHQGDFRKIVDGVNATLDAVIGPLNVAGIMLTEFQRVICLI